MRFWERLTRRERWLIGIMVAMLAGFAYQALFLNPVLEDLITLRKQLADQAALTARARAAATTAGGIQTQLAQARQRLEELSSQIPSSSDQASLLEYWHKAATGSGVTIVQIRFGDAKAVRGFRQQPVELSVSGHFAAQRAFLQSLQNMPRLARLEGATLEAAGTPPAASAPAPAPEPAPSLLTGPVRATFRLLLFSDPATARAAGAAPNGNAGPEASIIR